MVPVSKMYCERIMGNAAGERDLWMLSVLIGEEMTSEEAKEKIRLHENDECACYTADAGICDFEEAENYLAGMKDPAVKALVAYASHTYHCDINGGWRCNCGYAEALALYEKAVKT